MAQKSRLRILCEQQGLKFNTVSSYKRNHPELTDEQVIQYYQSSKRLKLKQFCEKHGLLSNLVKAWQNNNHTESGDLKYRRMVNEWLSKVPVGTRILINSFTEISNSTAMYGIHHDNLVMTHTELIKLNWNNWQSTYTGAPLPVHKFESRFGDDWYATAIIEITTIYADEYYINDIILG